MSFKYLGHAPIEHSRSGQREVRPLPAKDVSRNEYKNRKVRVRVRAGIILKKHDENKFFFSWYLYC